MLQGIKSFRRVAKLKFRQTAKTIWEVRIMEGRMEESEQPMIDSLRIWSSLMAPLTMEPNPKMGKRALGFNCRGAVMRGGLGGGSISGVVTRVVSRSC